MAPVKACCFAPYAVQAWYGFAIEFTCSRSHACVAFIVEWDSHSRSFVSRRLVCVDPSCTLLLPTHDGGNRKPLLFESFHSFEIVSFRIVLIFTYGCTLTMPFSEGGVGAAGALCEGAQLC